MVAYLDVFKGHWEADINKYWDSDEIFGMWNRTSLSETKRSWEIGMAEACFNINYVALHFDIHKTIAYRIINCFLQTKLTGDRPRSDWQKKN